MCHSAHSNVLRPKHSENGTHEEEGWPSTGCCGKQDEVSIHRDNSGLVQGITPIR